MNTPRVASCLALAALIVSSFCAVGCGGGSSGSGLGGGFTQSATATTPGLIKLVKKSSSGSHVVVSAVIYGPLPSADLYSFAFDVVIGDTTIAQFVPNSDAAGGALVPTGGQAVQTEASVDNSNTTHVVVGVTKTGGGSGNGFTGASAVVVNLTFALQMSGTTSLAIASSPAPQALDSTGTPIGTITFDTAGGTLRGTSTGGGGY